VSVATESRRIRSVGVGRRRRPSGEAPPLPRPIYRSGRVYLSVILAVAVVTVLAVNDPGISATVTRWDLSALRAIESARVPRLAGIEDVVGGLSSAWCWRVLRWVTLACLIGLRRFRHLAVYFGLLLVVTATAEAVTQIAGRMRPAGIDVLVDWNGYSFPSLPVVALGISLVGATYTLVPRGRPRNRAKVAMGIVMGALVAGRLYVGVDHPSDAAVALVLGMALPVVAFRFLTPDEVFPIRYRRRNQPGTLSARRLEAIGEAIAADLGWTVRQVVVLRPPGSSGSTPLRLVVDRADGAGDVEVFAKLYAQQHLRADRWYKFGRAVLYGRLEDEHAFASVRRLVEHEDHLLRAAAAARIPVPETFGYVTVTPEREYVLVTELVPDAKQIGPGVVTDEVIEQALGVVQMLWRAGIAHRDIKPANVVVSHGRVWLVDLSFGELRPTAWREAVDLATMMLTLGVFSTPARVYAAASGIFSQDEIGEAFAAAFSVTVPSQLRACLSSDTRDLRAEFAALVPPHPPIAVQRWSLRRVLLGSTATAAVVIALTLLAYNLRTVGLL
jgi:hypothetical protein